MGWKEEYEAEQRKISDEVTALIFKDGEAAALHNIAILEKRFFKNFGCMNLMSDADIYEIKLAKEFHRRHMQMFPEEHDEREYEPYRCYHVTTCKCGLETACDSSD